MKKVLILVFVLSSAAVATAQVQVALGIKAGPNFAAIDRKESPSENYKNRTGFHGGAFALIKIAKIGIQPEVIFSQQGQKVTVNGDSFESNFNYVNIPIMVKLYLIGGLNLQAGPQFGFLMNDPEARNPQGQTVEDAYKNSDVSVGLGAGWDLPFGLTVDARYNLGVSDINDSASIEASKNQVIQLSIGYKIFKFGK